MPVSRNRKAHKTKSRQRTKAMTARREKIMEMTKELEQAMQSLPEQPPVYTTVSAETHKLMLTQSETTEYNYGTF